MRNNKLIIVGVVIGIISLVPLSFFITHAVTPPGGPPPGPDTTPPSVPTNLAASGITQTQLMLNWATSTDPDDATVSYTVYRNNAQVATPAQNNFTDTGLTANTTYVYNVASIDPQGNASATSSPLSVTTQAAGDTQPPVTSITSPANNASVSSTITVTASASDNVGVTKVEFYLDSVLFATDVSSPYSWPWNTASSTNTSHTLMTKAYDAAGNVGGSANVAVQVNNVDTQPPSVPTGLTVTGTTSSTPSLAWSARPDKVG